VHPKGEITTLKGGRVGIGVLGDGPPACDARLRVGPVAAVDWNERRKAGFDDLADTMRELSAAHGG
jgi:hypothetical protein